MAYDISTSTKDLNKNLNKINKFSLKWRFNFNPDPTEQGKEVLFNRKMNDYHNAVYLLAIQKFFKEIFDKGSCIKS